MTELLKTFPAKTVEIEDEKARPGISVRQHGYLAAYVLRDLLNLVRLPDRKVLLPDSLMTLAALHDVGKVTPAFLCRMLGKCDPESVRDWQAWMKEGEKMPEVFHAHVSYAVLKALGAPSSDATVVAEHHGYILDGHIPLNNAEVLGGEVWSDRRLSLAKDMLRHLQLSEFPIQLRQLGVRKLQLELWKGWIALADWIASKQGEPVEEGSEEARAAELVSDSGFRPLPVLEEQSFFDLFGFSPRSAQSLLMDAYEGAGIYLLEAPTGCGKTEAALGLAFKALKHEEASGLYFALPTQLTSECAADRVQKAVRRFMKKDTYVKLIHGGVKLGKEGEPGGIWHTSARLALLAPFGVGTVDQGLLSVLRGKFHQVRLAGLCGKVVVLDEIHSYDAYTLTLAGKWLRALEAMGAVVIVLSATLTKEARQQLLGLPEDAYCPSAPVALSVKTSKGVKCLESPECDAHPVRVTLIMGDDGTDRAMSEVIARVREGQQVLWIENTVGSAQEVYARIRSMNVACGLLHSRYRVCERRTSEARWSAAFGKAGRASRSKQGRVLVGTQVLEQSLDLDADFLVTRLAPMDLLIQRMGRLWRHRDTPRPPACTEACAWILGANKGEGGSEQGSGQLDFGASGKIYHPYTLFRTQEALSQRLQEAPVLVLPQEVRTLLEAAFAERTESHVAAEESRCALIAENKEKVQHAKGALSVAHLDQHPVTRLMERPQFSVLVLSRDDEALLADCRTTEQVVELLEDRLVKSARPLGDQGVSTILDTVSEPLRDWLDRAGRYRSCYVCRWGPGCSLRSQKGTLEGVEYSEEMGLMYGRNSCATKTVVEEDSIDVPS